MFKEPSIYQKDKTPTSKKVAVAAGLAATLAAGAYQYDNLKNPAFEKAESKEKWENLDKTDFLRKNSFDFQIADMKNDSKDMVERLTHDWLEKNEDTVKSVRVVVDQDAPDLISVTAYGEQGDSKFKKVEATQQIGRKEFFDQSLEATLEEALNKSLH